MIKERAKELSDILLAYSQGKLIQISNNGNHWVEWIATNPDSIFNYNYYRIKPEPKLVPFTFEDNKLLQGKYICRNGFTAMYKIIGIDQNGVSLIHSGKFKDINYNDLFISYCFSDGSNCGKYINE